VTAGEGEALAPPSLDETFAAAAAAGAILHSFYQTPKEWEEARRFGVIFALARSGGSPLPFRTGWGASPQAAAAKALEAFHKRDNPSAPAATPPPPQGTFSLADLGL